jgi:hypothetical protein
MSGSGRRPGRSWQSGIASAFAAIGSASQPLPSLQLIQSTNAHGASIMIPWSEHRTEAFAGLHNQGKRIIVIFDEASAIPDVIWETTEGALTDADTKIIWGVFGNPTRNTGRFRECFGRFRHRWHLWQVGSRATKLTNKEQINQWIADYGEDSDFVRVRVRGVFPRAGDMQFISTEMAEAAMSDKRDPPSTIYDPLVLGVDVARFGDDATVLCPRRARDALARVARRRHHDRGRARRRSSCPISFRRHLHRRRRRRRRCRRSLPLSQVAGHGRQLRRQGRSCHGRTGW